MTEQAFDLAIIGAGPGGYVAAIRAAQLGLNVAVIEKRPALGGTCLNIGCIPSKALLESSERYAECMDGLDKHGISLSGVSVDLSKMMGRKNQIVSQLTKGVAFLFKKNKVTSIQGAARFIDAGTVEVNGDKKVGVKADKFIIATGSEAATLPGIEIDGKSLCTSTEALEFDEVPNRLVVIGAGVIGLELGSVWNRLGSEVTVLEYMPQVLPGADEEVAKTALRLFKRQGLTIALKAKVTGATVKGDVCQVTVEGKEPLEADKVLVAVGRRPNTDGLELEAAGVALTERGFIKVDENWRTSQSNIYAIGDVIGGPMLAHKASEEGVACVEKIATGYGHVNYNAVPGIVYTDPEVAWVGKTEMDLVTEGTPYKKGTANFKGNGRALALAKNDGLVKVLAHAETDRVLGIHIIGPRAGDLLAEATVAMEYAASSEDLARAFHAHPTLS
jgi:dihydrolipoamide dehydrogenase